MTLAKPKPIALYMVVCGNCHRVSIVENITPIEHGCLQYQCSCCGFGDYVLFAIQAIRLSRPVNMAKLVAFREMRQE